MQYLELTNREELRDLGAGGITNLTLKQLRDGRITSPTFTTTLKAFGALTLDVTVAIQQVGATGGSASLDDDGILHIDGSTSLTIKLQNVVGLGLPVVDAPDCQTAVPVTLPLKFDGPVSSLGNGNLTLTGQATFPKLQNCGLLTDALNLLFPGSGNDFAFTVTPPAPTRY